MLTGTSPKVRNQDGQNDDQSDDQQWTIVPRPEANIEENPSSRGASSHFDITLGRGNWKFTVFSWDMSVREHAGEIPHHDIQERLK